jgi:hypothetical protein
MERHRNRQDEPPSHEGCGSNILGCLILLAIALIVFAILWFAGLQYSFFTPPTR